MHNETPLEQAAEAQAIIEANGGWSFTTMAHDPNTWIIVAFLIFLGVFGKFVLPAIVRGLDGRSEKIRDQLEQASRLREQAEALLASYKAEHEAKAQEAEQLIANAKLEAQSLRDRAGEELKQTLERRSEQALATIARAEAEAVQAIRTQIIDNAAEAAREIVRTQLDAGKEDPAIARALKAIEKQLH